MSERRVIPCPCYDKSTGTDCKFREMGCHSTCKLWKEYEELRDLEYERREKERKNEELRYDIYKNTKKILSNFAKDGYK